jgi:solute:Na+ symporter, SSS family
MLWALAIIIPAILYATSTGSVLQTLSKLGSYFVGAQLSMYGLGFYSKHTTEKGLLVGVVVGFVAVWYVATQTDIAWPWYCLVGAGVNMFVARVASHLIDGPQQQWSPYSVRGQQQKFIEQGLAQTDGGWYLVPGKIDRVSYLLLAFFALTVLSLFLFEKLV